MAAPQAVNDVVSASYKSTAAIDVLGNDVANAGTPDATTVFLGATTGALPASRTFNNAGNGVVFTANATTGTITYVNPSNFVGVKTVGYNFRNTSVGALSNRAVLTVTLTNTAPVAVDDDGGTTTHNVVLNNINVAGNDTDADGNGTIVVTSVALVAGTQTGGTFAKNNNGSIRFTPTPGFIGTASVNYTVKDGPGLTSNQATLSIDVTAPPPPVANNDTPASVSYTSTAAITVLNNDVAGTGNGSRDATTVLLSSDTGTPTTNTYTDANGIVFTASPTGTITFTNPNKYVGVATVGYTFKTTIGPATSNRAVLTVTLTNAAPVALNNSGFTLPNNEVLNNIDVAGNDTDANGNGTIVASTVALTGTQTGGTFSVNPDGTINYVPASGFTGTASVKYTVQDEIGAISNPANNSTLSITVTAVADVATTITPSASPVNAGASLVFTVTYRNLRPSTATGFDRTLSLTSGLVAATVVVRNAATTIIANAYNSGSGTITLPAIATLASGATTADVTITITPVPGNVASLRVISGVSTSTSQNTATANDADDQTVLVTPIADVTTTLTGPTTVPAGQPSGNYTVNFQNNGPSTAAGVTRTVTLPAGATGVVAPGGTVSGTTITYAPAGGTMTSGQSNGFTFSFTASATPATNVALTSSIATTTDQGTAGAPDNATLTLNAVQDVTGYVFEDPNYGGGSGRPRATSGTSVRPGARVELYNNAGTFVTSATTDATGRYLFTVAAGTYTVRVVNTSVSSSRPGYVAALLPVQTYNGTTTRVGGEIPGRADAGTGATTLTALTTATTTAQSIASVTVAGTSIAGPDFGFNFSTIVNTSDAGQGSLRQFLLNSNTLTNASLDQAVSSNGGANPAAGTETSIFMISDGLDHDGLLAGLPNLLTGTAGAARAVILLASTLTSSDANTAINGTSQTLNVGNTNTGNIGASEKVGIDNLTLTAPSRPEVEIAGVGIAAVLDVSGSATRLRQLAIRGGSGQTINFVTGATDFSIDETLVGTSAINYAWAGDNTVSGGIGIRVSGAGAAGIIQGSVVSFTGNSGINVNNGLATTALVTIQDSEFNQNGYNNAGGDGISLGDGNSGCGPLLIEGNLFTRPNSSAVQFEIGQTTASIVRNNSIISAGKGGAGSVVSQLEGSAICYLQRNGSRRGSQNDLITKNVIVDTQASGIVVGYGQQNVTISQNSIFNSGSIAIDLVPNALAYVNSPVPNNLLYGSGDGVTINDGNDPAAAPTTLPNRGTDFPVLLSLDIVSGDILIEGLSRPGALIEFYIPSLDPTRFGEGRTFLATRTEGSGDDALAGVDAYGPAAVNILLQGQDAAANRFRFTLPFSGTLTPKQQTDVRNLGLTATATLNNSTSEFSGNVPFAADVVATITASVAVVAATTPAQFNVSFTNIGASAANGVLANVQLPAGLNVTSVTGGGTYDIATGVVSYPAITAIVRGVVLSSTITYIQPLSGASVTATAAVTTTTSQNGLTNNDAQSATIQTSPQNFDLYTTLAGPASTSAGQPVTYAVTTQNIGIGTALGAIQTVSVPTAAALTSVFVSNGGSYAFSGGTSTFTFVVPASLGTGQLVNNTFSFVAPAFASPANSPLNTLNFTALVTPNTLATGDQAPTNNQALLSTTNNVAPTAEANVYTTISSDAVEGSAAAGAAVTYTVVQGNAGPQPATVVGTSVSLNPNLTATGFSVNSIAGTQPGGAGTAVSFALPGGTATYSPITGRLVLPVIATQPSGTTTTYLVTAPAPADGLATVTSSVTATTADIIPADNVASTQVTVSNALTADLGITIVGPAAATASQQVLYTLTTTNNGAGQAQNVVTSAAIPAGLSISGLTAVLVNGSLPTSVNSGIATYGTGTSAATYNTNTGLVTIPTAVAFAGNSVVSTISYLAPVSNNNLVNVASVSTTSLDNVPANNTSQVVTTVQPQADVQVVISGPTTSVVGAPITLVVATTNLGPSTVPNQTITVQLPSTLSTNGGVEVRDNAGNVLPGALYNNLTGIVTLPAIVNQASGVSSAVRATISFISPAGSVFSPSATTSVPGTLDPDLGNNESSISVSVSPATATPRPNLSTSFAAGTSTTGTAGQSVTLVVQTANAAGSPAATGVVQNVMLSSGLTTTGFTVGGVNGTLNVTTGLIQFGTIATYNTQTGFLSIPKGTVNGGTSTTTTITLLAPGTDLLSVTAAVQGDQSDASSANNRANTIITITPVVDVKTTVRGPVSAPIGSTVTYSVVTTNNSVSDATNVVQTVTLPAGATNVVISGAGTQSGNVVTFPTINTLTPGTNGLITNSITFTVPNTTPSIQVTGNVTANGDSAPGGNNTSNQVTTTQPNRPPVASDMVNALTAPDGNTAVTKLSLSPLQATDVDGNNTVVSYTLVTFPNPATAGTLYVNGTAVTAARTLTATEAGQLSFTPLSGYVGNVFFTYTATDNGNGTPANVLSSNAALYTIPVGQDNDSFYAATPSKGGATQYQNNDVLAYLIDANGARYNASGLVYTPTGDALTGTSNGLPLTGTNALLAPSGSGPAGNPTNALPPGTALDPATGRIFVSNRALLPALTSATTYSVNVITTDLFGGTNVATATFVMGAFPLPVELVVFAAKAVQNRDAALTWTTASEKNNDRFEVERSFDGQAFAKIGQVAGQGSTSSATNYALTDANVAAKATGPVYYRLRQVDTDGTATYSPVRTVAFTKVTASLALSVYPNPATTETTLLLTGPTTATYQVSIIDATGRLVQQVDGNSLRHSLDLHNLATGTYALLVRGTADGTAFNATLRLIKE